MNAYTLNAEKFSSLSKWLVEWYVYKNEWIYIISTKKYKYTPNTWEAEVRGSQFQCQGQRDGSVGKGIWPKAS